MNEQELSEVMRTSLPSRPDATGWADAARRRARNRRYAAGGIALLAVVALAVPLALQTVGDATPPVVLATPTHSTATAQLVPDACQDPEAGAEPLVGDDLPEGVSKVWLCGRSEPGGELLVGAPDPLVARAGEAARAFNSQEKQIGVTDCLPTPEMPEYVLVFEYPDGTHRTVRTAGCDDLRDATDLGWAFRAAGTHLATLEDLWSAERADTGFRFTGTGGLCEMGHASVMRPVDDGDLSRVIACVGAPDGVGATVELPADVAGAVLASLRETSGSVAVENSCADHRCSYDSVVVTRPALVLLTPTGDPVSLALEAGEYRWNEGTLNRFWTPSAELAERIADATQGDPVEPGATSVPTASTSPLERGDGLVPKVCADIQSGETAVPDLPDTENLATGASRVWLCGDRLAAYSGAMGPVEPLVIDPDRVVAAVNAAPPSSSTVCSEVGGLTYHLALDYPDGSSRVVSAETVNCQWVGGSGQRSGGAGLLEQLQELWQEQRDLQPQPFLDDVELCQFYPRSDESSHGAPWAIFPVDRSQAARGVVCGLPADATDFNVQAVSVDLPKDLVEAIAQADPVPSDDLSYPPGLPYVVVLNEFGDPMAFAVDSRGRWVMETGLATPGPEVVESWAQVLDQLRTTAFYERPSECQDDSWSAPTPGADASDVVAGWACLGQFATPELGPELAPPLAAEIGARFESESQQVDWGTANDDNHLALRDAAGEMLHLYWDTRQPPSFVDLSTGRMWLIPDDIGQELARYGLHFDDGD